MKEEWRHYRNKSPHDTFGTHLNSQGKTVVKLLEKENFKAAGNVLASLWNELQIDNEVVIAQFIVPQDADNDYDYTWESTHVRQSQ